MIVVRSGEAVLGECYAPGSERLVSSEDEFPFFVMDEQLTVLRIGLLCELVGPGFCRDVRISSVEPFAPASPGTVVLLSFAPEEDRFMFV